MPRSQLVCDTDRPLPHQNQANTLIGQWRSLAMSSDQKRLLNAYGDQQSWTTLYNLYADKLLGTDLVDQSVRPTQFITVSSCLRVAQLVEIQADTLRGRMLDSEL